MSSLIIKYLASKPRLEESESKVSKEKANPIYTLYFDGASKGNPGPSGAGAVIYKAEYGKPPKEIWSDSIFVGKNKTNNVAEYSGLILGLEEAYRMGIKDLEVRGDSDLVIKQVKGIYKVKTETLIPLYETVCNLNNLIGKVNYEHVYRDKNKRADHLSNIGVTKNSIF